MPYVSAHPLTEWESPEALDSAGAELARAGSAVGDVLERQHQEWAKVGDVYEGESEPILLAAWDGPTEQGDMLVVGTSRADAALAGLAQELRILTVDRDAFEDERASFNAVYQHVDEADLPLTAKYAYEQLLARPGVLQVRYHDLIEACVHSLDGIREGSVDIGGRKTARATDWGEIGQGALDGFRDGFPRLFEHEGTVTVAGQAVPKILFAGWEMTSFLLGYNRAWEQLGIMVKGMYGSAAVMHSRWYTGHLAGLRGDLLYLKGVAATGFTGAFGGLAGATTSLKGLNAHARTSWATAMGELDQFRADWRAATTQGLHATQRLVGMNPSGPGLSPIALRDLRANQLKRLRSFGSQFLDGLPVVGEVKALAEGHTKATKAGATKFWSVSQGTGWTTGARALGTFGTFVGAGATYASEREKQEQEVWQENPGMSREEVQNKAAYNAGAQTVGQVGSTILASAATGAAAGTVVPGIGNVAGLVVGVATGVAMSVPLVDSDGDGERDSLSEAVGDGVEALADKIPDDVQQTVVQKVDEAVDAVGNAVGGFNNWVTGKG